MLVSSSVSSVAMDDHFGITRVFPRFTGVQPVHDIQKNPNTSKRIPARVAFI